VRLELAVLSKPGGRKVNEDACGVWSSEATGSCFCVVSDGAGGHGGGDVASKLVVEHALGWFRERPEASGAAVAAALDAANRAVLDLQRRDDRLADMRATAVVLALDTERMVAWWGHLGDSRLYCFRGGRAIVQTRDHSVIQRMVDAGYVEPAELRSNARRSTLLAALGEARAFDPAIERQGHAIEIGDAFLLCTDGLWQSVGEAEMERALERSATPEEWLRGLEDAVLAVAHEGHDNYSAVAVACGADDATGGEERG
jgi:serine/threonine protein phosphatase PrpC